MFSDLLPGTKLQMKNNNVIKDAIDFQPTKHRVDSEFLSDVDQVPNQFGFLEGKSTLAQLLSCFDDWASSRNKSRPTDVIFLNYSKAFDSVPHERPCSN